jgi:hypothetical protein
MVLSLEAVYLVGWFLKCMNNSHRLLLRYGTGSLVDMYRPFRRIYSLYCQIKNIPDCMEIMQIKMFSNSMSSSRDGRK